MVNSKPLEITPNQFNAVVVSLEDFSDNWDLTDEELKLVWLIAQKKMPDMLLQDLDLIMQEVVDIAKRKLEDD